MTKENYERNRARVCEIYGVDLDTASVHHIVQRVDVKKRRKLFGDFDVNQLSNLFPFSNRRKDARKLHTAVEDHRLLHQRLVKTEPVVIYKHKKKKHRR